jgi:hypothetical protein
MVNEIRLSRVIGSPVAVYHSPQKAHVHDVPSQPRHYTGNLSAPSGPSPRRGILDFSANLPSRVDDETRRAA